MLKKATTFRDGELKEGALMIRILELFGAGGQISENGSVMQTLKRHDKMAPRSGKKKGGVFFWGG